MTATRQRDRVVRSQVEPKLVERRREVQDSDRQRRRRTRRLLLLVVLVVTAMVAVLFSPLLDVDRVVVEGVEGARVDALVDASGMAVGDRMIEIDLADARDALMQVDGIRSASVTRNWPSTIRVVVTEERPVARLRVGEQLNVLSSTGRLLDPGVGGDQLVPIEVAELELVEGPVAGREVVPEEVLAAALSIDRLAEHVRAQVASAELTPAGSLSFLLTDGAIVLFGPAEHLPAKLGAAEAVLAQVEQQCRAVIDVREPSRVTVSRVEGCEPPPVTDTTVAEADTTVPDEQVDG